MPTSPSFEMTVRHFGVWTAVAASLAVGAAASLVAWWQQQPEALPAQTLAGGLALACLGVALHAMRQIGPLCLRWDGQRWSAEPPHGAPAEVDLTVAIDLGAWMLLRLRRTGAGPRRAWRVAWLPVQRRGHEAHWHALRCAVYSPRPASGDPTAAEP